MEFQIAIARSHWESLLLPFQVDIDVDRKVFFDLLTAYSSPNRFYHNLAHILQVLETIELMRSQPKNLAEIQFAAWFHDVIYDAKAKDNEEKSAEYAVDNLRLLEINPEIIATVTRAILTTKNHQPLADDIDSQILLDADLSILGATTDEYCSYAKAIRREYAGLSAKEYRLGRKQVLENFLQRERIYHTPQMFAALESLARHNIQEEIKSLTEVTLN